MNGNSLGYTQNQDELTLTSSDVIRVLKYNDDGWWHGELKGGPTGLFPSNYVQLCRNHPAYTTEVHSDFTVSLTYINIIMALTILLLY